MSASSNISLSQDTHNSVDLSEIGCEPDPRAERLARVWARPLKVAAEARAHHMAHSRSKLSQQISLVENRADASITLLQPPTIRFTDGNYKHNEKCARQRVAK